MRDRASVARVALSASENRQTGGGCVGGLLTCPCKVSSIKDGGSPSTRYGWVASINGRTAPTKLMHLSAHASELLELSWSLQHGQQGVSALSDIDISTGLAEMAAPPVAGTMATEMAIKTARIARAGSIAEISGTTGGRSMVSNDRLPASAAFEEVSPQIAMFQRPIWYRRIFSHKFLREIPRT
jgi:hypothetical protein